MVFIISLILLIFSEISEAGELWTKYDLPVSISCISGDSDYLWIGTTGNKIIRINKTDWTQTIYTSNTDSIGDNVQYIAADSSGSVFAGSSGWLSMFENGSWKPFHRNENGLMGIDIRGIKIDNDKKVWIAVNDNYFEEIEGIRYSIYRQAIQYYFQKELTWKSIYNSSQKIKAEGNWGMHVTNIRKNIRCFDISDSSYFAFGQEGGYYDSLILSNGRSGVFIDDIHHPSWIRDVSVSKRADKPKVIYVYAVFSDLIERLVYKDSEIVFSNSFWSILLLPFSNFNNYILDKENSLWFLLDNGFNNQYIFGYNNKFSDYKCPTILYTSYYTCLYADDQGYIWVGTQSDGLWRFDAKNATAIQATHQTPAPFTISSPYPNPFNTQTTISFTLTKPSKVNLSIYNLTGQKVRELAADNYTAGNHTTVWDCKNEQGETVSSGLYLARMESGGVSKVVRMAMVK